MNALSSTIRSLPLDVSSISLRVSITEATAIPCASPWSHSSGEELSPASGMSEFVNVVRDKIARCLCAEIRCKLSSFTVAAVVFAARYYSVGKGFWTSLLEKASASLPDGNPSGATVVNSDDLTHAVAFEWWHSAVLLERLAQLSRRLGPAAPDPASGGCPAPRRFPARLDGLLDSAARRALGNRPGSSADSPGLVFVFSHGGDGIVLSADRCRSALEKNNRLQVRRGSAGGRRPSVLAAYIDGICVTEDIGKIAVLPRRDDGFGSTTAGRALVAYVASRGTRDLSVLVNARRAVVAVRGVGDPIEYDLRGD